MEYQDRLDSGSAEIFAMVLDGMICHEKGKRREREGESPIIYSPQ